MTLFGLQPAAFSQSKEKPEVGLPSKPPELLSKCRSIRFTIRVARWYIFQQTIPIWVNFVGALEWKRLVPPFEMYYGLLVHFMAIL
jgi:hypothetical protein